MTEHKGPVDHALDLFVYGPLGFALEARSLVPKLVDRGRQQVTGQVTMARMVGQFAVKQGQAEAPKLITKVQASATAALTDLGLLAKDEPGRAEPSTADGTTSADQPAPAAAPPRPTPAARAATKVHATLAIPDYDSLAASQVIPRLAGLADDELEAVRGYEAAKRGRKTILNKIAQLQD